MRRHHLRSLALGLCALASLGTDQPDVHMSGSTHTPIAVAVPPEVLPGDFELKVGEVTLSRDSLSSGVAWIHIEFESAVTFPVITTATASECRSALGWQATLSGTNTATTGSVVVERGGGTTTSIPFSLAAGDQLRLRICGGHVSVGSPPDEPEPSTPPSPSPVPPTEPTTEDPSCGQPPRSPEAEGRGRACPPASPSEEPSRQGTNDGGRSGSATEEGRAS